MQKFDYKKERDFDSEDMFSKVVKAGRRTYFFDVKATRKDDYYITIIESRKKQGSDGNFSFEKHKIFLYKEDFKKFTDGLDMVIDFVKEKKPEFFETDQSDVKESIESTSVSATDIEFESL